MNEITRTQQYEDKVSKLSDMRSTEVKLKTLVRAYEDYSEDILKIPTKGEVADLAAKDLSKKALLRAYKFKETLLVLRMEISMIEKEIS